MAVLRQSDLSQLRRDRDRYLQDLLYCESLIFDGATVEDGPMCYIDGQALFVGEAEWYMAEFRRGNHGLGKTLAGLWSIDKKQPTRILAITAFWQHIRDMMRFA